MAPDCKKMIHPFQKDPGISQQQRLPQDLLSGSATIDGRTLADLLDFFVQLSRHVNYYDEQLQISDWQPFFRKSLPFTVAAIIKYDRGATEKKLLGYKKRFDRKPSAAGLELLLGFTYNSIIKKIDSWQRQIFDSGAKTINALQQQVSDTGLPLQAALDQLIKDKLSAPVKEFIKHANTGTTWFCTRNFGFATLATNPVWQLSNRDLVAQDEDFKETGNTKRKRLIALYGKVSKLVQSFLEVIRILGVSGEQSLEQSLLPLKEELKEKHPPHLAILFAFLKLFQYLQGDLNSYTRKHLDFFYKQVLKLKPKAAVPDKVHMVFEIQKQLDKYLLKKGLLLKDGKDNNKTEIYFATEDEIVVNKTQVADQRTLFLNNLPIKRQGSDSCNDMTVVEGVYIAPDATKANGVDKDFTEGLPARATLGDKWSKYTDPENKFILPYPNARIGFVMASPVLLLNEGKREITIDLSCKLDDNYCQTLIPSIGASNPCCDSGSTSGEQKETQDTNDGPPSLSASDLYNKVNAALGQSYYYVSRTLIAEAVKKGISKDTLKKLQDLLTITHTKTDQGICYCPFDEKFYETTIPATYNWKPCRFYEKDEFIRHGGQSYRSMIAHAPEINFNVLEWDVVEPVLAWDKAKTYKTGEIVSVATVAGKTKMYKSITEVKDAKEFEYTKWKPIEALPLLCGKKYYREDMIAYSGKLYTAKDPLAVSSKFDATKWQVAPFTSKGFEEIFTDQDMVILKDIFKPRRALNIQFSGEKEWLVPLHNSLISLVPATMGAAGDFRIIISTQLSPQEAAVTFYNAETLKENLDTTLPVVKIELDDKIKLGIPLNTCKASGSTCCEKELEGDMRDVSLYHFFRNVKLLDSSKIGVQVCGLKNLVVQNDENVENVNSPIRPFGSRPRVGASFYIGSKEIFSKNWQDIYINAEWKDKPRDFGEYYKHYSYKDTTFEDGTKQIINSSFVTTTSVLDKGEWERNGRRRLFKPLTTLPLEMGRTKPPPPADVIPVKPEIISAFCQHGTLADNEDVYDYTNGMFPGLSSYNRRLDLLSPLVPYNVTTQYGFLRLTLDGVSFQHDIFPFVLTRQMMAYAGLLSLDTIQQMVTKAADARKIIDAMINEIADVNLHVGHIQTDVGQLTGHINTLNTQLGLMSADLATALTHMPGNIPLAVTLVTGAITRFNNQITTALNGIAGDRTSIQGELNLIVPNLTNNPGGPFNPNNAPNYGLIRLGSELSLIIDFFEKNLKVDPELKDGLPSEPYTPIIKSLSLDYTATADVFDIDLIHLYPYAGTYKPESLPQQPMLFPTFCDEGNFYIGLKDLVPGSNVNILFQLAEATADSESERKELVWYYLENNAWKLLRTGFEVLNDDTNGLTTSGIIKFLLPANMTNENTILPKGLHWIKATIPQKSKSVSEIIGIHTQAIKAVFTNETTNDKLRLSAPLSAGSVGKLKEADANVKKIAQPYEGFGGREPEEEKHFYIRACELLRHKNRAIQKFDYERLVLEAFPQIFKVKCINHTYALDGSEYFNDFLVAPGYVMIAVIPDLNQLKAAKCFEPRAPVSMLEDIAETLKKLTSPFVRLWIKNPRYEKVNFCLKIKLMPEKDEVYYKEKLEQDIREFLAPWAVGEYEKLAFGQSVGRSDMIRFLETRDYLDYIIDLKMIHEDDDANINKYGDKEEIIPITPRSILIAGTIDVCIDPKDCETWCECGKDAAGNNIPCCDHKKIPIMEYCKQKGTEQKIKV